MRRVLWPAVMVGLVLAGAGVWWTMRRDLLLAANAGAVLFVLALAAVVIAWIRGHRGWSAAMLALVVGVVGAIAAYGWSLNSALNEIPRIDDAVLQTGPRPPAEPTEALNLLLLGSDNPDPGADKPTVAELLADGDWSPGAYRSDSIMVLHISADRRHASMVSIPRDSYVRIYDGEGTAHELNKINAAFSYYGPFGTLRTVENLTGLRIDHLVMIDFEGFRDVTAAVGGVDVYVPRTFTDTHNGYVWEEGWHHLEGEEALRYVRTRYGLAEGDFDRVRRQQNFLRALLTELTDEGTIGDPATLKATVESIVPYLTIDSGWTSSELRSLAVSLRHLRPERIGYATVALDHYETIPGVGAANIIDQARAAELWEAIRTDEVKAYLKRHPDDGLPDEQNVG